MPSTDKPTIEVARGLYGGWLWRLDDEQRTVSGVAYLTRWGAAGAGRRWARKIARAEQWEPA